MQGSLENLDRMEGYRQASRLFADCSSSNGGMIAGLLSVIGVTATCIVVLTMDKCDYQANQHISNIMRIVVLTILIVTAAYCYYIVAQLEVNPHPISLLDDLLLFFSLPMFFLYTIVWMLPLVNQALNGKTKPDAIVACFLFFLQPLVQTPMIVDGLRRCTNDPNVMKKMPGRNVITFLIVSNLATYLMETLLFLNYHSQKDKIDFYGADAWIALGHVTLPVTIFYGSLQDRKMQFKPADRQKLSSGSTQQLPLWTSGTRRTSRLKTHLKSRWTPHADEDKFDPFSTPSPCHKKQS